MTNILSSLQNLLNPGGGSASADFMGPQQPPVQGPPQPTILQQISAGYEKNWNPDTIGQQFQGIGKDPGFNQALMRLGTTLLAAREKGMGLGEGLSAGQTAFNSEIDRAKQEQAKIAAAKLEQQKYLNDMAFKLQNANLEQSKFGLEQKKYGTEANKTAEELNLKRQELGLKVKEFEKKYENGGLTPQDVFDRGTKLRGEFTTASKDFVTQRDAFAKIQTAASDPSAAGDISLVYSFMKLNDPTSTVREGEFATAQNAGAVPERVRAAYNKAVNGERLADSVRKDFVNTSGRLYKTSEAQHNKLVDQYTGLAKKVGADPTQVALDSKIATPPPLPQTPMPGQATGFKFLGFK